jgi:hypothetical protein
MDASASQFFTITETMFLQFGSIPYSALHKMAGPKTFGRLSQRIMDRMSRNKNTDIDLGSFIKGSHNSEGEG